MKKPYSQKQIVKLASDFNEPYLSSNGSFGLMAHKSGQESMQDKMMLILPLFDIWKENNRWHKVIAFKEHKYERRSNSTDCLRLSFAELFDLFLTENADEINKL